MRTLRVVLHIRLVVGLGTVLLPATAQTTSQKEVQPTAPGLRRLTGDDAKKAEKLDEAIEAALEADRWDDAIARAEELLALRVRAQGPKHFEMVNAHWTVKTLRNMTAMPHEDRVAYKSAIIADAQGKDLYAQGKYAQAQPLFETALAIRRRLLTDDNPLTVTSYGNLATNLNAQGKYAQAQPLYEQALEIIRRLHTDNHPDKAFYINNVAMNLNALGKYGQAQPLYEEALAIRRRLLTDDHIDTAQSYYNLAANLTHQRKHVEARTLNEKALAIRRRLLGDDHLDTARSYNDLAYNLVEAGKYAQAQPLLEKALAIRRRLLGDDHLTTAHSYYNLAMNLGELGRYAQAQPLCEKALAIRRRLLGDDHLDTVETYLGVAAILNAQARYTQAQALQEKALAVRRRLLSDDHPDTAEGYNRVAITLDAQGKYSQAQPLFEKALAIRRRLLSDDHLDTARSYNNLADNLKEQGKYAQAQPLHEKALEIIRRLLTDDHPDTAFYYNSFAKNLNAQGKYAQAQPLYEKALEIRRRLLADGHPDTAVSYNNLAGNLNAQGKHAQAQSLLEKALEIRRGLFADDHPDTAQSYNNLAVNLGEQGKYAQALPLHEKALEIYRRLLGDGHPDTALSFHTLGFRLRDQGKYGLAQPLFEKALEIRRQVLTEHHPDTANSYSSVAANLDAQGRYTQAQPLHEKSLAIRRLVLTEVHPFTARSYNNLAANLSAQGNYLEARDRWKSAVKSLDAARLRIAFTGLERAGTKESAHLALAAVLARLSQSAEAWQALEEELGRGLLDELISRQDSRLSLAERAGLRELMVELERLDKLVDTTPTDLDKAERAKQFDELQHQRNAASIALGEFQTKLVRDHGPLAGQVASLNEIQAGLPADAALIVWVDIPPAGPNTADPDGEHWGVVVRARGTPTWVATTGTGLNGLWTQDDTGLAARVRTQLRSQPGAGSTEIRPLIERLRTQRFAPLARALAATADGLPPARRLIVLPSRALAGIPFEVLLADDDTRTISYAPSATVFKYLRDQPRPDPRAGLLALGDPVYEHPDPSSQPKPLPDHGLLVNVVVPGSNASNHGLKPGDVLLAYNGTPLKTRADLRAVSEPGQPVPVEVWRDGQVARRELAPGKLGVVLDPRPAPEAIAANRALNKVLVAARSGSEDFAPLPGTRYEVEALAQVFQSDHRPTRALLGGDASEPVLDGLAAAGELGRFGFIHLATHGVIDEATPTRSAVILTQTGLPDPLEQALKNRPVFDGRLSVREIQRSWELKAELVTLSACETALGRDEGGEGFVGFTQALLISGARSVCLSLWKVDDTATALLMQRFYADLLGRRAGLRVPMPKAEALREAKAWLRNLRRSDVMAVMAERSGGAERGKGAKARQATGPAAAIPAGGDNDLPYASPHYWAAFVLAGDPD
jgi:tetratricopeptide (TPR) repeat protein